MDRERFEDRLNLRAAETESIIFSFFPECRDKQKTVFDAMRYSITSGGKRIRPMIMLEAFRLFKEDEKRVYPFMAAIEMIHTYSLIHDDLPAMDNDDLRRGRPTNHRIYGEAMAILAGDGLLNLAFETVADGLSELGAEGIKAFGILAKKAGCNGMIGGQAVDIEAEKPESDHGLETVMFIHEHKTAALLEAAFMIGGVLGGCTDEQCETLEKIGSGIGLAFQIKDDILDVTGSVEELGKPIGSDDKNSKVTYVTINGIEAAEKEVDRLSNEAKKLLSSLPGNHEFLMNLTDYLVERKK